MDTARCYTSFEDTFFLNLLKLCSSEHVSTMTIHSVHLYHRKIYTRMHEIEINLNVIKENINLTMVRIWSLLSIISSSTNSDECTLTLPPGCLTHNNEVMIISPTPWGEFTRKLDQTT